MKKGIVLMLLVISLTVANSFGQRLRYRNIKNDYSLSNYNEKVDHQHYSPFLAGALNFVLPTVGYYYVDEAMRGMMILGGELLSFSVAIYGLTGVLSPDFGGITPAYNSRTVMYAGVIALNAFYLWSIIDVVHIALVKNMALEERRQGLTLRINPDLGIACILNRNLPVAGIRLTMTF
ncbi:MAG: hypothetical protein JXR50_09685 [Prolixibacteraceae bacterium]|nr:hypothetical protein [Prolixibacteraceae bacterium]MBN2649997.1 hypothetical protein [Prolixibacteraceae bacterium]